VSIKIYPSFDLKLINQIANFALLEWPDNIAISDDPPSDYMPRIRQRFPDHEWQYMSELHALPDRWEYMAYDEFLEKRRLLMLQIIKKGFETLK